MTAGFATLLKSNTPLLEIDFGTNNHTRNFGYTPEVYNFIVHNLNHVEGISGGD